MSIGPASVRLIHEVAEAEAEPETSFDVRYLLLLNRADDAVCQAGTPESEALFEAYGAVVQAVAKAGVQLDWDPLTATSSATTVRVRNGETVLTDGPAAELREQVGTYTIIDCADLAKP